MHHISSKCDLLTEDGKCVDSSMDSKVEFHFNALLDAIADQKKDLPEDQSLEGAVVYNVVSAKYSLQTNLSSPKCHKSNPCSEAAWPYSSLKNNPL